MIEFSLSGEKLTVYNYGSIAPVLIQSFSYTKNINGSLTFSVSEPYVLYDVLLAFNAIKNVSYLDDDGEIIADRI